MFVLFVSEFNYYLTKEVHAELFVDTSRGQKLRINVDITFPHLPCGCKYLILLYYLILAIAYNLCILLTHA